MTAKDDLLSIVESKLDPKRFREQHWEGSFFEYLQMVSSQPQIARNAFQRLYDMIVHFGTERFTRMREDSSP